ncbi:hypothetical protein ABDJ41_03805 [Pedobacter sp. ASV1-7]|uniref:hypothetical protein n=1 Tax=Pedobacter sp. ASV1-7 TaxID=3145237 RepID=UPI0032E86DC1
MKKIILGLLLLTSVSAVKTYAQMGAATKVNWDIEKNIEINMEMDLVWDIFASNEQLQKASNGYVSAIEVVDPNFPMSRKISFKNGGHRFENITQSEAHNKLIAISFSDTDRPKGIKSAQYAIFIKAKGNQTSVMWRAKVDGNQEAKKALVAQLNAEYDSYAQGLEKMTKKVIPAARMN